MPLLERLSRSWESHEDWLLRTYRDYTRHSWVLGMEAFETIRSYSLQAERLLRLELDRAGLSLVSGRVLIPYDIFFNEVPARHLGFLRTSSLTGGRPTLSVCTAGSILVVLPLRSRTQKPCFGGRIASPTNIMEWILSCTGTGIMRSSIDRIGRNPMCLAAPSGSTQFRTGY